jgi:hypothetical protein
VQLLTVNTQRHWSFTLAEQTVLREKVYGVHTGNNRWFGAIVLFANTIIGRLILLLIPTFLIFFYEPIVSFFKTITKEKEGHAHGDAVP